MSKLIEHIKARGILAGIISFWMQNKIQKKLNEGQHEPI